MTIELKHERNTAMGWDIDVIVTASDDEEIADIKVTVNGFSVYDEVADEGLGSWHHLFTAQGQYPGDNVVFVRATNQSGKVRSARDAWK